MANLESDQDVLVMQRTKEITDKYRKSGYIPPDAEITPSLAHECVLKEVFATLSYQKRLHTHVSKLEIENAQLEKANEERKMAPPVSTTSTKVHTTHNKINRKNRDHRSRSQEWPDVPDIGKIDEENPEILAQKILETGRQIEAGKLGNISKHIVINGHVREGERNTEFLRVKTNLSVPRNNTVRSVTQVSPVRNQKSLNIVGKVQESPKVINFEDRLKSIITSVLNEDQEQRKAANQPVTHSNYNQQSYNHQQSRSNHNNTNSVAHSTYSQLQSSSSNYVTSYTNHQNNIHSDIKISIKEYKPSVPDRYQRSDINRNPDNFHRHSEVIQNSDMCRSDMHRLGDNKHIDSYKSHGEQTLQIRDTSPAARNILQPDYTQVSPAKLALRRHLSQEKLSQHPGSIMGARTIGDLVNGEIERTLEISNQSIINAAVNMSAMLVTPNNVINANIPPRPERVNVRVDIGNDNSRQTYSPISRSNTPDVSESFQSGSQCSKSPPPSSSSNNGSTQSNTYTSSSPRSQTTQDGETYNGPPRTTVVYHPKNNFNSQSTQNQYVPLPRAEIKPYHDPYFNDTKPVTVNSQPLEGLAACLQARVLASDYWKVKEETNQGYPDSNVPSSQPTSVIKTEVDEKSPLPNHFNTSQGQKRASPVIQGPLRPLKKQHMDLSQSNSLPSPEPHSNTSTPLVDEMSERDRILRPDEGTS